MPTSLSKWISLIAASLLLAACAAPKQNPVSLDSEYLSSAKVKQAKLGVALAELPKPNTFFPGADCLLCIAVASAAHTSLSRQVDTFTVEELKTLPTELVALLRRSDINAVVIAEPLKLASFPEVAVTEGQNKARRSFASIKAQHGVDRLLVIDLKSLGITRSYSAYIPTGIPRATADGNAFIVDLSTNNLEWYLPIQMSRASEGAWDEPSKFPGLTNAYYQLLESVKDSVKQPFARK